MSMFAYPALHVDELTGDLIAEAVIGGKVVLARSQLWSNDEGEGMLGLACAHCGLRVAEGEQMALGTLCWLCEHDFMSPRTLRIEHNAVA